MPTDCERILSRDKEDEQKIARCSRSYIERFFVKSDAVAGQKTPQDAGILMNSLVTYFEMLRRTFTLNYLAFLFMRLTGIALALYLFLHIWSIGQVLEGTEAFEKKMLSYNTPFGWALEYALLLAVLYHMLNGLRVIIADFFGMTEKQKAMLWFAGVIVAIIGVATLPIFFPI